MPLLHTVQVPGFAVSDFKAVVLYGAQVCRMKTPGDEIYVVSYN